VLKITYTCANNYSNGATDTRVEFYTLPILQRQFDLKQTAQYPVDCAKCEFVNWSATQTTILIKKARFEVAWQHLPFYA